MSGSRTSTHSCPVPCRLRSRTRVPLDERSASSRTCGCTEAIAPGSSRAGTAASPTTGEKAREIGIRANDANVATWGDHVTADEYAAAPAPDG